MLLLMLMLMLVVVAVAGIGIGDHRHPTAGARLGNRCQLGYIHPRGDCFFATDFLHSHALQADTNHTCNEDQ
jgi:hypothetical protein